jgi:hypothetical protein
MSMITPEVLRTLKIAEEALGNNLVWLDDALDLRIRQGDKETLRRLAELNAAWGLICRTLKAVQS